MIKTFFCIWTIYIWTVDTIITITYRILPLKHLHFCKVIPFQDQHPMFIVKVYFIHFNTIFHCKSHKYCKNYTLQDHHIHIPLTLHFIHYKTITQYIYCFVIVKYVYMYHTTFNCIYLFMSPLFTFLTVFF